MRRAGLAAAVGVLLLATGCASPGPPRAPSLQLPATVSDLVATRRGAAVELQFAVPARTSDGMAYRGANVRATVCRAVEAGACVRLAALSGVAFTPGAPVSSGGVTSGAPSATLATLHDALPGMLAAGPVRLLTYRVELSNPAGRTAGFGDAAYAAAGTAPAAVAGLQAKGSREGVELRWQPEAAGGSAPAVGTGDKGSEVVLRRELVSGVGETGAAQGAKVLRHASNSRNAKDPNSERAATEVGRPRRSAATAGGGTRGEAGVVWLSTAPVADPLHSDEPASPEAHAVSANGVVDDSAAVDSTYRYAAERQHTAQLGGHTLVLHSGLSAPVEVTLRGVYPPPAPTDLVGTVFPLATADDPASEGTQGGGLAVDLIWTPADDAAPSANRMVGYLVSREMLDASGAVVGSRVTLTPAPIPMPAFHDVLPRSVVSGAASQRIRYSVAAVDAGGLSSAAVTTVVETSGR